MPTSPPMHRSSDCAAESLAGYGTHYRTATYSSKPDSKWHNRRYCSAFYLDNASRQDNTASTIMRSNNMAARERDTNRRRGPIAPMLVVMCVALTGCAVVYSDQSTGTVHVWGVGHIAMRATASNEGKQGIVRAVSACGVSTGVWDHEPFITVGWERKQRVDIVDSDTVIRIEQAGADLMNINIGSRPPMVGAGMEKR